MMIELQLWIKAKRRVHSWKPNATTGCPAVSPLRGLVSPAVPISHPRQPTQAQGTSWRATVMGSVYHCLYCTELNLTLSRFAVRRRTMLASGSLLEVAKQPVGPFRQQPSGLVCSLAYRKALGRLRQNPANTELAMYRLSRRLTCHVGDGASQPRHLSLASHIL